MLPVNCTAELETFAWHLQCEYQHLASLLWHYLLCNDTMSKQPNMGNLRNSFAWRVYILAWAVENRSCQARVEAMMKVYKSCIHAFFRLEMWCWYLRPQEYSLPSLYILSEEDPRVYGTGQCLLNRYLVLVEQHSFLVIYKNMYNFCQHEASL